MVAAIGFVGGMFGFGGAAAFAAGGAIWGGWALGASVGSTVLGSLTVRLLTSVAFSALQQALSPSPQGGGIAISTTLRGEDNPETIVLGKYATGGQAIAPPYSHGKSNRYMTHIIELCSAPGAQLDRLMLGDEWVDLGPTPHADYGRPVLGDTYGGHVWIKYYDGSQSAADPMLRAKYGSHPDRPWTADMIGAGICYAILTFYYDQEDLPQIPRYRFELSGLPVYDIRKDSTAGGVGPQRLATPSTWTVSHNAIVLAWNVMRGILLPGGDIWGGNITDLRGLPQAVWVAAMNRCDVAAEIDGGTEPMYRAGIEAMLDQPPAAVLEELLKAASATIADHGYGWGIIAGAPPLPVYAFTDEDVIVSRPQERDPFPALADTYNAVTAKFPDPKNFWETKEAPQRTNVLWETADAFGRRSAALSLPAVPYADQVQRLMHFWIEDERRFIRHVITLPPDAAHVELTDTITWTSERNGYVGKDFTVHEIAEDPRTGIRQVSIRERNPSDWVLPPGYILPTAPAPLPTTIVPSEIDGFGVAPAILYDADGSPRRGGIRIGWSPDIAADGIRWQMRLLGSPAIVLSGTTQNLADGYVEIYNGPLPAAAYEVQACLIVDRPVVWTAWAAVTVPAVLIAPVDIDTPAFSVAGLAVFGGDLKSDDYAAGLSGWRIAADGAVELNSLVVRTDMIVNGAISRRAYGWLNTTTSSITESTYTSPRVLWSFDYDSAPYEFGPGPAYAVKNPSILSIFGEVIIGVNTAGSLYFQIEASNDNVTWSQRMLSSMSWTSGENGKRRTVAMRWPDTNAVGGGGYLQNLGAPYPYYRLSTFVTAGASVVLPANMSFLVEQLNR